MKKTILSATLAVVFLLPLSVNAKQKIAGSKAASYTILYSGDAEAEEGIERAQSLQRQLSFAGSLKAATVKDFKKGRSIVFAHDAKLEPFGYAVSCQKGTLTIRGGGCWAMEKASQMVADQLKNGDIANGFSLKGSVDGQVLFPVTPGANLRILDDNIWDYSAETIPDAWQKIGVDCRDNVRAPQYAQLVRAYMPDVVGLQEYNHHMHVLFYPAIQKYGYRIAYDKEGEPWDNTPIFYNSKTTELVAVNYVLYTPGQWSNVGSKSFTSAVFKQKATGKTFAYITTHLWWKSESKQPGSDMARASQIRLVMAEAEVLKAKYNCPVFVTGDMNCYESDPAIRQLLEGGYVPCYKAATVATDKNNGHHICSPGEGFSRKSNRRSADRTEGAIDHCLIYNAQNGAEIKAFKCEQSYFTLKLTDHYPNVIDAKL